MILQPNTYPTWMGFTEVRTDSKRKSLKTKCSSGFSDYKDAKGRQWRLLSKGYDAHSWGGLVEPTKSPIVQADAQGVLSVYSDNACSGSCSTTDLYKNPCLVRSGCATWCLNTGPGKFQVRLHLLDWAHGEDRRFILELSSGDAQRNRYVICTPPKGVARVDKFVVAVEYPATTVQLCIRMDDEFQSDALPCFAGFEVEREISRSNSLSETRKKTTRSNVDDHLSQRMLATLTDDEWECEPRQNYFEHRLDGLTGGCNSNNSKARAPTRGCKNTRRSSFRSQSRLSTTSHDSEEPRISAKAGTRGRNSTSLPARRSKKEGAQRPPWVFELEPHSSSLKTPLILHPEERLGNEHIFTCVNASCAKGQKLAALLAAPAAGTRLNGMVLTSPGAGGGPGPFDPLGGGGGGTYGPSNLYWRWAAELPKIGIAVVLLHYPNGAPTGVSWSAKRDNTADHLEALAAWFKKEVGRPELPTIYVGWSMGGSVVIEAGARSVRSKSLHIRGVATVATGHKHVRAEAPGTIVSAGAELMLLHGLEDTFTAQHSREVAKLAGIQPLLFPGEDHGLVSAYEVLTPWVKRLLLPP